MKLTIHREDEVYQVVDFGKDLDLDQESVFSLRGVSGSCWNTKFSWSKDSGLDEFSLLQLLIEKKNMGKMIWKIDFFIKKIFQI